MARKRASLKDKGPETLGLTQKKGKGLDALFGGPSKKKPTEASASATIDPKSEAQKLATPKQPEPKVKKLTATNNDLAGLVNEASIPPPPVPAVMTTLTSESLPVNEADDGTDITSSEEVVDELGLPVAMEAPPPDLELATPVAEPAPRPVTPTPPPLFPPVSSPLGEVDESDDLSGLAAEDDLSGLATEAEAAPAPTTIPPANLPPSPPPVTAAPAEAKMAPPVSKPPAPSAPRTYTPPVSSPPSPAPYKPPTPTSSTTYTPRPATLGTPPSTATGAPSLSMPRSKIESVSGIVTERMKIEEEDLMPEDTKIEEGRYILDVEKRAEVEEDEDQARRVNRYIGRDRRENLDREIEVLYKEAPKALNDKPEEVSAALKILREAQDIIFEDARQYDEALYRVATVRAMLAYRQNLERWSYTWGLFVFFYALTWLIAFIAGLVYLLIFSEQFKALIGPTTANMDMVRLALTSAASGGVGGVSGILYSLYWHVSHKRDFHPQYVMYYLTQPILGFILGALIYFITAAGFLVIDFSTGRSTAESTLISPVIVALQVALGWFAGFRQRVVLEMIEKIMQRLLGKSNDTEEEEKSSTSSSPAEEFEGAKPPAGEPVK